VFLTRSALSLARRRLQVRAPLSVISQDPCAAALTRKVDRAEAFKVRAVRMERELLHASERVSIAARSIRGVLEEREQALVAHVEEVVLPAISLDLPALLIYKLYIKYNLYSSR